MKRRGDLGWKEVRAEAPLKVLSRREHDTLRQSDCDWWTEPRSREQGRIP